MYITEGDKYLVDENPAIEDAPDVDVIDAEPDPKELVDLVRERRREGRALPTSYASTRVRATTTKWETWSLSSWR